MQTLAPRLRLFFRRDQTGYLSFVSAFQLEWLTVGWMTVEALAAIAAGWMTGSLVLAAFGLDSLIELRPPGCSCGDYPSNCDQVFSERAARHVLRFIACTAR